MVRERADRRKARAEKKAALVRATEETAAPERAAGANAAPERAAGGSPQ